MQLVRVKEVIVDFRATGAGIKFGGELQHKVKMGKAAVKFEYPDARWWTLITQDRTRYFATSYGRIVAEMTLVVEVICGSASNGA